MTERKRIVLNIAVTYGRSVYALVLGLFTARWALLALGQTDFGLYGLIGGLTSFFTILNNLLATGVARFYAVSVGSKKVDYEKGLENCRRWFCTAFMLHSVLAVVLVAIGYPVGMWAIENYLTIPPDRVGACVWVWRYVCISCLVAMANVPFSAMYRAKQEIAELTIFSLFTTTVRAAFLFYIVRHGGDWLSTYAFVICIASVIPQALMCFRAVVLFEECKLELSLFKGVRTRIRELFGYSGWLTFGFMGGLAQSQGVAVLINKMFGPSTNAALSIGNSVSAECGILSGGLLGAFSPAIMNAYGAGDMEKVRRMSFQACKLGTLLLLVLAIPLCLEVDEVLRLWLKEPPEYASGLCVCVLASIVIDKTAAGHLIAVNAHGRIALYQVVLGTCLILALPLAWVLIVLKAGVYSVGYAIVVSMSCCALGRVWFARYLVKMSSIYWLRNVLIPLAIVAALALLLGAIPRLFMRPSFFRVAIATLFAESALAPLAWFALLDASERHFLSQKFNHILRRKQ